MLKLFLEYIKKEKLFAPKENILLTVSGGVDSVLMCELFHLAGFKFGIAHCNFQLRDEESNEDAAFVKQLAKKYKAPFYTIKFNTTSFAKKNKLSTQLAARQLRYQWFEEIRQQFSYDFIATAHHLDDVVETYLINTIRGTGISGLHGIFPKQGAIIRPLLFTNKRKIMAYTSNHKINYREDSSNQSDYYLRNKIRHQLIPLLKELNPAIEKTIINNVEHLKDVELIYKASIEDKLELTLKATSKELLKNNASILGKPQTKLPSFSIKALKKLSPINTFLYEFLKPYSFNSAMLNDIAASLDSISGKQFYSDTHRLIKDRDFLFIERLDKIPEHSETTFEISKNQAKINLPEFKLLFSKQRPTTFNREINSKLQNPSVHSSAQVDFDKLHFPLIVRKWEKGDSFYPLGMKNKKN